MSRKESIALIVILVIAAYIAVLVFSFGILVGHKAGMEEMQWEAIDAGHAIYAPVDQYGKTEFRWLSPCNERKVNDG